VLEPGAVKFRVDVNPPAVSVSDVVEPWRVRFWPLLPTVKLELGLMTVRPVREVMFELAPELA
jgi:hypothetical protein